MTSNNRMYMTRPHSKTWLW